MSTIQESERTAIQEELVRFLRAEADEDKLRSGMQSDRGYDHAIWQKMAEMGLLGIAISEDFGGIGGSAIDTAMVTEELGRSLLPVPFMLLCWRVALLVLSRCVRLWCVLLLCVLLLLQWLWLYLVMSVLFVWLWLLL